MVKLMQLDYLNVYLACKVGVESAIILSDIIHTTWGVHDGGLYWVDKSAAELGKKYPYIKTLSISRHLRKLESGGWLISRRDLNKNRGISRTKWYAPGPNLQKEIN